MNITFNFFNSSDWLFKIPSVHIVEIWHGVASSLNKRLDDVDSGL